jgi:hypothetical protein
MEVEKKKGVYFFSGKKHTDFIITSEVKDIPEWTFNELTKRHSSFKSALFDIFVR